MALVTSDILAGMLTNFRAIWNKELGEVDPELDAYLKIATVFPSTSDKESYGWLGSAPAMKEWKDKRQLEGMNEFDYTLTNKHYESTIEVDRDTIEDDKYGLVAPRIRSLALTVRRYFNESVFSQLDGGASYKAFDGSAFFKTNRTIKDSGTIDNLKTGAYSGSSTEILTALALAVTTMKAYKNDKGVKMNLTPDTIVCSPKMELAIKNALLPAVAGTVRPEAVYFPNDRIIGSTWIDADDDDFYVMCTRAEVKPVILQMRKEPEFDALDDPKSEHVFMNKTFLYGVDTRFVPGFGDPRTCIKFIDS